MPVTEAPRNLLGEYAEALIADVLDKREAAIINTVLAKLNGGHPIEPQFAIQKWIELCEARKLRATLINRTRQETARQKAHE